MKNTTSENMQIGYVYSILCLVSNFGEERVIGRKLAAWLPYPSDREFRGAWRLINDNAQAPYHLNDLKAVITSAHLDEQEPVLLGRLDQLPDGYIDLVDPYASCPEHQWINYVDPLTQVHYSYCLTSGCGSDGGGWQEVK